MADDNDLNSLLSELQQLKKSKDYLNISNTLDRRFHSKISDLIKKWISDGILSSEEEEFFDLYSNLQLSFVEYCFFNSDTTENVQMMISKFPANLFNIKQTDPLAEAVAFIRDLYINKNSDDEQKNDLILVYIMRMLDARSFAYRLCFKDLRLPPTNLNNELRECLTHRHAKNYLYDVKSMNKTDKNIFINDRHKFFIGCCSYAIALFDENKGMLKDDDQNKYICLLVKYVRIMLSQNNFEQDKSILYCLRGVFALLTNCVPTDNWINIINKALANEDDDNAQQANPFNIDLFSLIINRLLGSHYLRDKAIQSDSYNATSLVDIALIFLNKWFDISSDLNNDDEDDNNQNNNKSVLTNVPNQVLRLLRSDTQLDENLSPSQIIIPYIDAKYDRLRLMAISTLSSIMSHKDFQDLQEKKVYMGKDIVKLIFHFIDRAIVQETHQYKGISFERLLCFLLRFLVQDSIKEETLPYISQIINYAKNSHLYALKILRKMSTSPKIQKLLLKNTDLERFLKTEADNLYKINPKWYKYIENIRQNLVPPKPTKPLIPNNADSRQAFISYCHKDKDQCNLFVQSLKQANIFKNIWIDSIYMKGNIVDTITLAIRQSDVVFVLLSDAYCNSDMCRREWEFAASTKKKVCSIFVQEDFRKDTYDWVLFHIGNNLYYKINKEDDLKHLIDTLLANNYHQTQSSKKIINNSNESHAPLLPITEDNQPEDIENTKNQLIADWTSEDIQTWCRENKLEQWCEPLANYQGRALLGLNKFLKTDTNLQYIATSHNITMLDVILFKFELEKLISGTARTRRLSTKKNITKRRTSNASTK